MFLNVPQVTNYIYFFLLLVSMLSLTEVTPHALALQLKGIDCRADRQFCSCLSACQEQHFVRMCGVFIAGYASVVALEVPAM